MSKKTQVIIQAGGKGTRMEYYCWNRPKCLLPLDGKPLVYHIFDVFPEADVHVIGDHLFEVLKRYTETFPPLKPNGELASFTVHHVEGTGTCAGIAQALQALDPEQPVFLAWSDLKFYEKPELLDQNSDPMIDACVYLTRSQPCRFTAVENPDGSVTLKEKNDRLRGVMGAFYFKKASMISEVPLEGEFVSWLDSTGLKLKGTHHDHVREFGTAAIFTQHWHEAKVSRFFNHIQLKSDRVEKSCDHPQHQHLIVRERQWYQDIEALGYDHIPHLYKASSVDEKTSPEGVKKTEKLTIQRIFGLQPHDYSLGAGNRGRILDQIIQSVEKLHKLGQQPPDESCYRDMYYTKIIDRIQQLPKLLPEITTREEFRVNGIVVRNILHKKHQNLLNDIYHEIGQRDFCVIHGDITFSNMIIDDDEKPWLIDPRGGFGSMYLYGDPLYDWAKLYYSVAGNYDAFNRKQFLLSLKRGLTEIEVEIPDNGWSYLSHRLLHYMGADKNKLQLIHALIWLSLSGYMEEDYDGMLAAYFNGLYHMEIVQ